MSSKGVILAGGTASRMYPLTIANNKHLLPVYSKPMIYYSLSTLLLSGEREIVIVTSEQFKESFYSAGDGKQFGIKIDYAIQEEADGLASAINAAGKFIKNKRIKVILGDNIFFGKGFEDILKNYLTKKETVLFTQKVNNPEKIRNIKKEI